MSSTADEGASQVAARLGFTSGQVVQEFGYDDDVDDELRSSLEAVTGAELVDEEYDDVTDGAVIWFRDGDGDLTDALVDAMTVLDDGGPIWVLTPKAGRSGHVSHSDIEEAATTSGPARDEHVLDRRRLVRHPPGSPRTRSLSVARTITVRDMADTPTLGAPAPDFSLPDTHGTPGHAAAGCAADPS